MRCLRPIAFPVLLMGSLQSGVAAAEPPATSSAPNSDALSKADALFQEGRRFVAEQKWAQAEGRFLAAWRLNPTFDVATNLGHTQAQLGKYRDAAENLAFALRNWPIIPEMAKRRALAQKQLDEVRPFVAGLSVRVNMPDAVISVDGQRLGTSPMKDEIFVNPGAHTVEATFSGYDRAMQTIEAAKGATLTVNLTLKPSVAPSTTTVSKAEPAAAQPQAAQPQRLNAQPMNPQPLKPQPTQEGSKLPVRTILIGVGFGTSAALIGTGIGFAVASSQKASDANSMLAALEEKSGQSPCFVPWRDASACSNLATLRKDQARFADAAAWTLIAGGVVGAGTLVYTLATRKKPESKAFHILPAVGTHGTAVVLQGQW